MTGSSDSLFPPRSFPAEEGKAALGSRGRSANKLREQGWLTLGSWVWDPDPDRFHKLKMKSSHCGEGAGMWV